MELTRRGSLSLETQQCLLQGVGVSRYRKGASDSKSTVPVIKISAQGQPFITNVSGTTYKFHPQLCVWVDITYRDFERIRGTWLAMLESVVEERRSAADL
jgi:hypothetical protein